ncbi:MAG: tetratricopeptide repeat protein, partial [Verrucomicrobia bacterium]|nr:tetratricopeptide repeat protein [Verrucomicrobiota bacterium]
EIYEQLVRENPGDLELMQALKDVSASRTMKEGGYETAVETNDFRAALKDRAESDRLEKENRLVQTAASSASIIEDLEAKVQAEPNNMRWWRALADQYSHAKDYDKALNAYETLEKLFPGTDPQLAMRIISIKLKKVDEQLKHLDPNTPEHAEQIAALKKERAEIELSEMERLSEANPTDMVVLFDLGSLYFKNGKISKAIQAFQKTQTYPGKKVPSLCYLGQCFAKRKMYDLAVRAYTNALSEKNSMDDEKKELIYLLGLTYEMMGKKEEAINQFKLIYEVDIGYKDVAEHVDAYYDENE